jgi:hypothetical protein
MSHLFTSLFLIGRLLILSFKHIFQMYVLCNPQYTSLQSVRASVADPECFIPDPRIRIRTFSILDPDPIIFFNFYPGSYIKRGKKNLNYLFFLLLMVSGACFNSQKDYSSRIRKKIYPDPGVKRHRITDLDPQHWFGQ